MSIPLKGSRCGELMSSEYRFSDVHSIQDIRKYNSGIELIYLPLGVKLPRVPSYKS